MLQYLTLLGLKRGKMVFKYANLETAQVFLEPSAVTAALTFDAFYSFVY
jgi:hypothetical protein